MEIAFPLRKLQIKAHFTGDLMTQGYIIVSPVAEGLQHELLLQFHKHMRDIPQTEGPREGLAAEKNTKCPYLYWGLKSICFPSSSSLH